jgi:hypothetical protein
MQLRPQTAEGIAIRTGQQSIVGFSCSTPFLVPLLHRSQFDLQESGLHRVHASVVTFDQMVILLSLAVLTDDPDLFRQILVIGRDGSGLSAGAEILRGIKAECGSVPDGSGPSP